MAAYRRIYDSVTCRLTAKLRSANSHLYQTCSLICLITYLVVIYFQIQRFLLSIVTAVILYDFALLCFIQVCIQLPTYADNVALPAFAHHTSLLLSAGRAAFDWYLTARRVYSSKPCWDQARQNVFISVGYKSVRTLYNLVVKVFCLKFWHKLHLWLVRCRGTSPELGGGTMYPPVPIVPTPLAGTDRRTPYNNTEPARHTVRAVPIIWNSS